MTAIERARALLGKSGSLAVVNGDREYSSSARGVKPLTDLLSSNREMLRGASVADKIVGKAAALLMAAGIPMRLAGDEFNRSQNGNNNPYCQDNAITWLNWEGISRTEINLAAFVRRLIRLRKQLRIFNRKSFFVGKPVGKNKIKDISWYNELGHEMTTAEWQDGKRKSLAYSVYNEKKYIFCILNANYKETDWALPDVGKGYEWKLLFDSSDKFKMSKKLKEEKKITVPAWSVILFEICK